jgi:glycerate 2-kinase
VAARALVHAAGGDGELSGEAAAPARRWLLAPDAFKGTLTAAEVADAMAVGIASADPEALVERCPLADGGEGTLDVLVDAFGGWRAEVPVRDPLGRVIVADIGWADEGRLAIVEVARTSGLALLAPGERDAEAASSAGTGEMIGAAAAAGAREIVVAAGGSASTDGGAGAIAAIESWKGPGAARLTVLADVQTPFERAAAVFAPQKGADAGAVERLQARLAQLARELPRDPTGVPMSGAAGGLAGGLWARYGARLVPGADWIIDAVSFDERLARATHALTGEGRLDAQTLEGKTLYAVARSCRAAGVPLHAIVGRCELDPADGSQLGLASVTEAGEAAAISSAAAQLALSTAERHRRRNRAQ